MISHTFTWQKVCQSTSMTRNPVSGMKQYLKIAITSMNSTQSRFSPTLSAAFEANHASWTSGKSTSSTTENTYKILISWDPPQSMMLCTMHRTRHPRIYKQGHRDPLHLSPTHNDDLSNKGTNLHHQAHWLLELRYLPRLHQKANQRIHEGG